VWTVELSTREGPSNTCRPEALASKSGTHNPDLQNSRSQFLVCTSKKRPAGDSQRVRQRDITQGTQVPRDGPAEVSVCLEAGRHKGVAGVYMSGMRPALAPVTQSGSGASHLGRTSNAARAAINYSTWKLRVHDDASPPTVRMLF
jgi:hypothetical protein